MTVPEDSVEMLMLRREVDRHQLERIARIEQQISALEHNLSGMHDAMQSLKVDLHTITARQLAHEPTMESLERIVSAGVVLRWAVIFVVGSLAAIGTAATAIEIMKSWLKG